jgi:Sec-independent protein translocase protein TatA
MFGIGGGELFFIAFVALIVFGPQRIPELARTAARGYRELLKLRRQVDSTLAEVKHDLQLDQELGALGLDEPHATGTPVLRPPEGERASARARTVAHPAPRRSEGHPDAAGRFVFEALPVPEADDYLAPTLPRPAGSAADPEDYLGNGE